MTGAGWLRLITIINYGMGNVRSVAKAFEAVGAEVCVSDQPSDILAASRIVLPGVGAFGDGMKNLISLELVDLLREQVMEQGKPFLGICLGMQLLALHGHEHGVHPGLGWLPAESIKLEPDDSDLKIPHVGWNDVEIKSGSGLFNGLEEHPSFYFVHGFHLDCSEPDMTSATFDYGGKFIAAIQHNNIFGTQFHPEKSQKTGAQIIRNFVAWAG